MAMKYTLYHFGRLNLMAVYEDKAKFLSEIFHSGTTVEVGLHYWGFFDVQEITLNDDQYFYGYLVKFKPKAEDEIADTETQHLETEEVENRAAAKSRFFLHVHSGLLAYCIVGHHVNDRIFRSVFAKLIERARSNFFTTAEVAGVDERQQIFEELKTLTRVDRVDIRLHPTNPSYSPIYKRVDERLKILNAGSSTEIIKAKEGKQGLQITGDEDINSKITMAEDGYGVAQVEGERDGKPVTISTSKSPITVPVPKDEKLAEQILRALAETFKKIQNRIAKAQQVIEERTKVEK